jgi:hypothetical protein
MTEAEQKRGVYRAITIVLADFAEQTDSPWIRQRLADCGVPDVPAELVTSEVANIVAYFPGTFWDPRLGPPRDRGGRTKRLEADH